MGLIARPVVGKKKSQIICDAFVAGAPKSAVGEVFYGVDQSNAREWNRVQRNGVPYFYIDNSYFDSVRSAQFRVTRNAMQIDAMKRQSDGRRFDSLHLEIKPLQHNVDGHWVLIEQSAPFMQLVGEPTWFHDSLRWLNDTGRHVLVRTWSSDKLNIQRSLPVDLQGAWTLMTHSSAAAVTALLDGIPVIVSKTSAVASVRLSTDNSVDDRRQAMNVLADNQFTLDEMKEGMAWAKVGS